jgi:ectoine hydroxylase-related dioxygenase (phytanoyl-CoA dioxygenase family)
MTPVAAPSIEPAVHAPADVDGVLATLREYGYAVIRGLYDPARLTALDAACTAVQERLLAGELDERYGTLKLVDDPDGERTLKLANYVTHVTELDPVIRAAVVEPALVGLVRAWLGESWLLEGDPFGVVLQDARPGSESSYTRIGWHSDWQSSPHLDRWPSLAFTIHLDETSPANGFLRVVPGSHRWATSAPYENVNGAEVPAGSAPVGGYTDTPPPFPMPLRFEKIRGETAVYCERGDVILHDAYLWHSAARATDDAAIRRHLRGGWYSGVPDAVASEADFVKNAAR